MKWTLQELNKYRNQTIMFDETLELNDSLKMRETNILNVAPIHVSGSVEVLLSEYVLFLTIETTVTLPSTRSLEPVQVPLTVNVSEVYQTKEQMMAHPIHTEMDDSVMELEEDFLDLIPAIEDHILLSLPLQVLSNEELVATELPKGDSWQILTEEDYKKQRMEEKQSTIDPRLAKLSLLLNEEDDEQ